MTVLMNWNVIHWRGRHVHLVGSAQFKRNKYNVNC